MSVDEATTAPSGLARVARGTSWTLLGQLLPTVATIFLTPYVLHHLGLIRYGLFVLTGSIVSLLATFDGGIKNTAQRYFGVYAGQDDVRRTTRLLVTLLALISTVGLVLSVAGWFLAAPVVSLLNVPVTFRGESVFLFRTMGVLITFSFIHNLFVAILQARHRFAYITKAGFAIYAMWAGGLLLTVRLGLGLRGIAAVFVGQQVFLAAVIVPASLRYARRSDIGFLERNELREFVTFAGRVQISSISVLLNDKFDALLIGAALSVRTLALYNAGSSFAENAGGVPLNGLAPAQAALTNTLGSHGPKAAFEQYRRLQRLWTVALTGWFAAAGAAAWFALTAWLGPAFGLGGTIAIVALASTMLYLYSAMLRTWCSVIGRPGIESRFGLVSVGVNLALTIPLVFTGAIGVIAATAAGQLIGSLYILRLARRELDSRIPSFYRGVPVLRAGLTAGLVVGLELVIRPAVPSGALGLVAAALPAGVGLAVFCVLTLGPRYALGLAVSAGRRLRGGSWVLPPGEHLRLQV